MEVYGTLMLVATRPPEGLIPFTALLESGWTTTEVFGANLEALDERTEVCCTHYVAPGYGIYWLVI